MAFFSLTDIKYVPGQNRQFELNPDQFNIYNKRYPIDVGNTDKAHYMMFFINVQERTQVNGYTFDDTTPDFVTSGPMVGRPNFAEFKWNGVYTVKQFISRFSNKLPYTEDEIQFDVFVVVRTGLDPVLPTIFAYPLVELPAFLNVHIVAAADAGELLN